MERERASRMAAVELCGSHGLGLNQGNTQVTHIGARRPRDE